MILVLLSLAQPMMGQSHQPRTLDWTWENDSFPDLFGGRYTDRHYTQGMAFSFYHYDAQSGGRNDFLCSTMFCKLFPTFGMEIEATRGGIEVGQRIYTPEDIAFGRFGVGRSLDAFRLQADDRPYAGYLYLQPQWERRGLTQSIFSQKKVPTRDRFGVSMGVVGPSSLAEEAQRRWHEIFNGVEPVGWNFQLQDEFTINVQAERTWLLSSNLDFLDTRLDLMPTLGVDLGTVSTRLTVGCEARFGFGNIHEFFLPSLTSGSESRKGAYLFGAAEGWLVGHNIFLDGNVYQTSHSVDKEVFVGEISLGVGLQTDRFDARVSWVRRSIEFESQDVPNSYLSATLSFRF